MTGGTPRRSCARASADGTGATLFLKVRPNARRDAIEGATAEADGSLRLRVAVAAPPEGGKANRAVAALLATAAGVPKSAVEIRRGAASSLKTVLIKGDAATILARVRALEADNGA